MGGLPRRFDLALAVGSLEHSGLGRYGEALDPWADLVAMARIRCLLKPGGRAFVAVPTAKLDGIVYNSFKSEKSLVFL